METTTVCPNCDGYEGKDLEFISSDDTCPECGHRLANETDF